MAGLEKKGQMGGSTAWEQDVGRAWGLQVGGERLCRVWEGVGRRGVDAALPGYEELGGPEHCGVGLRAPGLWRDVGYRPLDQMEVLGGLGSWGWGHRAEPWVRALAQPPSIPAGVVQSIKDHITKPTAMARGRVAHLIEWKGWSAQRAAWELPPEDDEHYCHLPDELCEARFAAGVAEQFAITEATLSAWSSLDDGELRPESSPLDVLQLQDLGSIYLQDSLLSVRSQDDSLLAFSSPDSWPSPDEPPSLARQLQPRLPGALGPEEGASPQGPPRSVDGGPPSEEEDEVFYN